MSGRTRAQWHPSTRRHRLSRTLRLLAPALLLHTARGRATLWQMPRRAHMHPKLTKLSYCYLLSKVLHHADTDLLHHAAELRLLTHQVGHCHFGDPAEGSSD
jgi:hypothetical protein